MEVWKRNIVSFLTAQTVSLFGSGLVQFAIIWYITLSTSSGKMMTISTICAFLPQVLLSLFAGVWIDKYNRKNLIMLSDGVIALSTLVVAILFLTGHKSLLLLFIALAIRSAGAGIQNPAVNAILPQIVPKDALLKINGINASLLSLTMFLAPAVSAGVLSFASIEAVFFIDVITAIIGISITALIPITPHEKEVSENSSFENFKNGLIYLKENPKIKKLLIFQIVVLFLVSPAAFLTPLLVSRTFGTEYWRLSICEMSFSFGAALGGVLVAKICDFKIFSENKFNLTVWAAIICGICTLALGLSPAFWVYVLFNAIDGISLPSYNSPITSILQEEVPETMQGRVFSFMHIATATALPLGMVIFGPLADIVSVQSLLITAGALIIIYTIREKVILSREL